MAILLGVQICTTSSRSDKAGAILAKMEKLLEDRHKLYVTRRQFLDKWRRLRTALLITKDYQDLILRVKARAKGICEFCHKWPGVHVHHIEPVAFKPKLVLLDLNCAWTCHKCHPEQDRRSRTNAVTGRVQPEAYSVP